MYEGTVEHLAAEEAETAWLGEPDLPALPAALLLAVLDEIDYGIAIVDPEGGILFANQLARSELAEARLIQVDGRRLSAHDPGHAARIATAMQDLRQQRRSLVSLAGADTSLTLSFAPATTGGATTVPGRPFGIVVFGRRDSCNAFTLRQFGNLHGLSGAEQAVLPGVSRGLSAEDIARQNNVGLATVRTQISSIRTKTGNHSMRALMAHLMKLPPIRPVDALPLQQ